MYIGARLVGVAFGLVATQSFAYPSPPDSPLPPAFRSANYGDLRTADSRCITAGINNRPRGPITLESAYIMARSVCGHDIPDLTNDPELQFDAKASRSVFVVTVRDASGVDNWAVCGPGVSDNRFHCAWLNIRSTPDVHSRLDEMLPLQSASD